MLYSLKLILKLVFSPLFQDNLDELKEVMKLETGLLGYMDKYWRGFFPILIVELFKEEDEFHISTPQNEPPSEEYLKLQTQLTQLFGEVHLISMKESEMLEDWLLKNMTNQMARLFLHARIYQCSRFFGADVIKTMPSNQR